MAVNTEPLAFCTTSTLNSAPTGMLLAMLASAIPHFWSPAR